RPGGGDSTSETCRPSSVGGEVKPAPWRSRLVRPTRAATARERPSFLLRLRCREDGLPVVLDAGHDPASLRGLIQPAVELPEVRLPVVGVLARRVRVVGKKPE